MQRAARESNFAEETVTPQHRPWVWQKRVALTLAESTPTRHLRGTHVKHEAPESEEENPAKRQVKAPVNRGVPLPAVVSAGKRKCLQKVAAFFALSQCM